LREWPVGADDAELLLTRVTIGAQLIPTGPVAPREFRDIIRPRV